MPVKSPPRERPLIEMFLSAYENDAWKNAALDWVEEKQDGAVEVVATRAGGTTLALEHTLIQPFVGEKFDSERFIKAFARIEKNPALVVPERSLNVIIPVGAIPKGCNWEDVGEELLACLTANHAAAPEGYSAHAVTVGMSARNAPLVLNIGLQSTSLPGMKGNCLIARDKMPRDLWSNVEKALRTKLPKLVGTPADQRVLLFERDQMAPGDNQIYEEVVKLAPAFPDLARVDEIWFANTSIYESEGWAYFALIDGRGLVELMKFQDGVLQHRRDDRAERGPAQPIRTF
jgi:hypothetical protein